MVPSRKKSLNIAETPQTSADVSHWNSLDLVDQPKIAIRRNDRSADPRLPSHLVVKKIAGGIRKCAGCSKEIKALLLATSRMKISSTVLLGTRPTISGISLEKATNWHLVQGIIISILSVVNHTKV